MIFALEGTGDCEGWAFVFTTNEPGSGVDVPVHGYVYRGGVPRLEMPDPVEPPAD